MSKDILKRGIEKILEEDVVRRIVSEIKAELDIDLEGSEIVQDILDDASWDVWNLVEVELDSVAEVAMYAEKERDEKVEILEEKLDESERRIEELEDIIAEFEE